MADRDEPPDKRVRMDSEGQEEKKPYKIQKIHQTVVRKYGVEEYTFRAKFNDDLHGAKVVDVKDDIHAMFSDVMAEVDSTYAPGERVRLSINHDGMDREITIHLQQRENITSDTIMER